MKRVQVTFTMDVHEDITDEQLAYVVGAAHVQFAEPVLSTDDDGNETFGVIENVSSETTILPVYDGMAYADYRDPLDEPRDGDILHYVPTDGKTPCGLDYPADIWIEGNPDVVNCPDCLARLAHNCFDAATCPNHGGGR